MKSFPPYSRKLANALLSGKIPPNDVYLFVGYNAWNKAKAFNESHYSLCLPPYEPATNYEWKVAGCSILLFETGNLDAIHIEETAYCLLSAGATIVRAIDSNYEMAVYCCGGEKCTPN